MIYKTKVDWWIAVAILFGILVPPATGLLHGVASTSGPGAVLFLPALGLTAFMLLCVWPQSYEVGDQALVIRAGVTKRVIGWKEISRVAPSDDSRRSLALSVDRVLIEHSGGSVLIAPQNQERFFQDVASHCPQLSWRGMELAVVLN